MDFLNDANLICDQLLTSYGIDKCKRKHPNDSIVDFFIYWFRIVGSKKRVILKSDVFSCPPGYESKLMHLESVITNGDDLRPYMSKSVMDLSKDDNLLSDWHIFHLHLSDSFLKTPLFADRSDYLVLSMITDNEVLFLKCIRHPGSGDAVSWALIEYLEIVLRNWPVLMHNFRTNHDDGPVEMAFKVDSSDIAKLRKYQINSMIELSDGNAYLGPGMGISGDGSPAWAVTCSNTFKHNLLYLQKNVSSLVEMGKISVVSSSRSISPKIKMTGFDLSENKYFVGCEGCENQLVFQKQQTSINAFIWKLIDY